MIIFLSLFLLCTYPTSTGSNPSFPGLVGHELHDAYGDAFSFTAQAENWLRDGVQFNGVLASMCDTTPMIGGDLVAPAGIELSRTYTSLPAHDMVFYSVRIHAIDWQPGKQLLVTFEDTPHTFSLTPGDWSDPEFVGECGAGGPIHNEFYMVGSFPHSSSELKFTLDGDADGMAFYGISSLKMRFAKSRPPDLNTFCMSVNLANNIQAGTCTCEGLKYLDSSGVCQPCHPSCDRCFGPTDQDCYTCADDHYYDFENNACVKCVPNCLLCSGREANECTLCKNSFFLHWDFTCRATCLPINQQNTDGFQFCHTPCQDVGKYQLWDSTCADSCGSGLPYTEGNAKFCEYPCDTSQNEYLAWDGSCVTSCSYPRVQNGFKFCDHCFLGGYKYPDTTCLPQCSLPNKTVIIGELLYCNPPCDNEGEYYYPSKSQCKRGCKSPYQIVNNAFCELALTAEEVARLDMISKILGISYHVGTAMGGVVTLLNFNSPTAVLVTMFGNMLTYTKYIKVNYPLKLRYLFSIKFEPPFNLIPQPSEGLVNMLPDFDLPGNFREIEEDLPSRFLINFWNQLIMLTAIAGIILITAILDYFSKKSKLLNTLCERIKEVFMWNFSLGTLISYSEDIVLFSSFEFRVQGFDTLPEILSFVFCFIVNLLMMIVLVKTILIVQTRWKIRKLSKPQRLSQAKKLDQYKIIFEDFKLQSIMQQSFLCIFIVRVCSYVTVIAYLYEYPIAQAVIIVLINVAMIIYLLISRPFNHWSDLLENVLQEIIMLIGKVCVLILAIMDQRKDYNTKTRDLLDDIFLGCHLGLAGMASLYLLIKMLVSLKGIFDYFFVTKKPQRQIVQQTSANQSPVLRSEAHPDISQMMALNRLDDSPQAENDPSTRVRNRLQTGNGRPTGFMYLRQYQTEMGQLYMRRRRERQLGNT